MPPTVDDMLFDLFRLRSAFRRQIEGASPEGVTETVRASLTETVLAALRERDKEIEHLLRIYTQSLSECIMTQTKLYDLCNGPMRNQRHQRSRGGTPYSRNNTRDWKRDGGALTRIVGRRGGSKILINNLDLDIDEDDIEEIFQEAGEVKDVTIDTDDGGRNLGIAHVTFQDPADAVKAVQEYDAANVDGRPMFLRLIEEGRARRVSRQAYFDDSVYSTYGPRMTPKEELFGSAMFDDFSDHGDRGRGRGGGRGRGRRRYGASGYGRNLSSTSQANLDADLDEYISKYETPSIIVDPTADGQPSGMEVEDQSVNH